MTGESTVVWVYRYRDNDLKSWSYGLFDPGEIGDASIQEPAYVANKVLEGYGTAAAKRLEIEVALVKIDWARRFVTEAPALKEVKG